MAYRNSQVRKMAIVGGFPCQSSGSCDSFISASRSYIQFLSHLLRMLTRKSVAGFLVQSNQCQAMNVRTRIDNWKNDVITTLSAEQMIHHTTSRDRMNLCTTHLTFVHTYPSVD